MCRVSESLMPQQPLQQLNASGNYNHHDAHGVNHNSRAMLKSGNNILFGGE